MISGRLWWMTTGHAGSAVLRSMVHSGVETWRRRRVALWGRVGVRKVVTGNCHVIGVPWDLLEWHEVKRKVGYGESGYWMQQRARWSLSRAGCLLCVYDIQASLRFLIILQRWCSQTCRPVLKHGPRSLTCMRVYGEMKNHERNESEMYHTIHAWILIYKSAE